MAPTLTTPDLNRRATSILSDPAASPVPETIATPLAALITALTDASEAGMPVPGYQWTRTVSLAVLDAAETKAVA